LVVPLLTCEAVVAETCFLLGRDRGAALAMLEAGSIQLAFGLHEHVAAVRRLLEKYSDVPMALADACLVRMVELRPGPVVTLDHDFLLYRAHGRRRLDLVAPFAGSI
jgi:predicted nucleic acid-binding protein